MFPGIFHETFHFYEKCKYMNRIYLKIKKHTPNTIPIFDIFDSLEKKNNLCSRNILHAINVIIIEFIKLQVRMDKTYLR